MITTEMYAMALLSGIKSQMLPWKLKCKSLSRNSPPPLVRLPLLPKLIHKILVYLYICYDCATATRVMLRFAQVRNQQELG